MRYQKNGDSANPVQAGDLIQNLISSPGIQPRGGLIQNQHLGIHGQNPGNGHPPFLAAGQLKGGFCVKSLPQSHMLQRLPGPFLTFLLGKSLIFGAKTHIRQHIRLKQLMLRILEYQSHLTSQAPQRIIFFPDILPFKQYRPIGGPHQAIQQLGQRGLSTAGMTDHSHKLALGKFKVHILQGVHLIGSSRAVGIVHMLQLQHRLLRCFSGACGRAFRCLCFLRFVP